MEVMKRLSIIIPMYNVEPYIARCLLSLEDQDISMDDFEIICINDGSPDNSRRIVINLQKEFNNILLIDQENQGVSRARNNGIDKAMGKYILFIDPDDYVKENSLSHILDSAERNLVQVSFIGYTILNINGEISYQNLGSGNTRIITGTEAYLLTRGDGRTDPDRLWAVLLEQEFLNHHHLRYLNDVPYLEDGELVVRILFHADRCIFDNHPFYQRTTRLGSATNSTLFYSEKATRGFLLAANNLKRFQKKNGLSIKQRDFLNQPIVKFVLLAINSTISWSSYRRLLTTVRKLKALGLRKVKLAGCNREYRIYGEAYNFSPWLGVVALLLYARVKKMFQLVVRNKY